MSPAPPRAPAPSQLCARSRSRREEWGPVPDLPVPRPEQTPKLRGPPPGTRRRHQVFSPGATERAPCTRRSGPSPWRWLHPQPGYCATQPQTRVPSAPGTARPQGRLRAPQQEEQRWRTWAPPVKYRRLGRLPLPTGGLCGPQSEPPRPPCAFTPASGPLNARLPACPRPPARLPTPACPPAHTFLPACPRTPARTPSPPRSPYGPAGSGRL